MNSNYNHILWLRNIEMLKILPRAIKMFDRGERRKSLETKFTSVYAESSPNPHECKIGNILVWV